MSYICVFTGWAIVYVNVATWELFNVSAPFDRRGRNRRKIFLPQRLSLLLIALIRSDYGLWMTKRTFKINKSTGYLSMSTIRCKVYRTVWSYIPRNHQVF